MRLRFSNGSVILAMGASVVAHLTFVVPMLLAMMTATGSPQRIETMFSSAALVEDRERREQRLGIERSDASTFTWIGYEEYQEHIARLAEIEQAAFTDEPVGSDQLVEALDERTSPPPIELSAAAIEALQHLRSIQIPAQLPQIELPSLARALEAIGLRSDERDSGETEERVQVHEPEKQQVDETDAEAQARERQSQPAEPVEPAVDEGGTAGDPGDAADKQSDPTSTIDAPPENWRLGRPLAAEGVELKPQRPVFSIVQRLTASPCNPLVEMCFDRAGVVISASIIESSRDTSIDAAVQASAYRWRAEGEELGRLGEEDTFNVRIRFILNPYARCP